MVRAVDSVKYDWRIIPRGRGRRDDRKRIGRTNPFRIQAYAHHNEGADTGHRINPRSTLRVCSCLVTKSRVMKTGIRGLAAQRRATSLPLPRSAGYKGDALPDRVIRVKHITIEEIE